MNDKQMQGRFLFVLKKRGLLLEFVFRQQYLTQKHTRHLQYMLMLIHDIAHESKHFKNTMRLESAHSLKMASREHRSITAKHR